MPCPPSPNLPALRLALPAGGAAWAMLLVIGIFFGGLVFLVWRSRQRRAALLATIGAAALCAFSAWLISTALYEPWFAHAVTWENTQLHLLPGTCFARYSAITASVQNTYTSLNQIIDTLTLASLALLLIPGSLLFAWPKPQGQTQ